MGSGEWGMGRRGEWGMGNGEWELERLFPTPYSLLPTPYFCSAGKILC
ncbi:hypothetical protein PI95_003390 [Hassallia byssoidea VB512170]|uniref:Uncharacterized protein n=1 Tax=Hassallia byssoidea VB512170 TaxID=1304833 RepID=A0A846H2F6_9CYAN|nr:hypothetical protein [Hassalia byssoidea]NEU71652.1 hypothetical protein [Hassalia byssoidea VB512170]